MTSHAYEIDFKIKCQNVVFSEEKMTLIKISYLGNFSRIFFLDESHNQQSIEFCIICRRVLAES